MFSLNLSLTSLLFQSESLHDVNPFILILPQKGMQTKFKRHQPIRLLHDPNPEYIEYHNEGEEEIKEIPIKKGMQGKINIILPNGQYHVEIDDTKGKIVAYVVCNEEDLEEI